MAPDMTTKFDRRAAPGQSFEKIYLEVFPHATARNTASLTPGLITIAKVENPSYEFYRAWHDRVGTPWGWHLRPRINDRAAIEKELAHPLTEMGQILNLQQEVGYYLVVGDQPQNLEISDFGFAPEHSGKKFGSSALPELLSRLFEKGAERIWLSTRSTNDPRVATFYEKFGFREYKRETQFA